MLKPCLGSSPGALCPFRALTPRTRCSDCQRQYDRQRRPTTAQRGYGSSWQAYSRHQRDGQPWCSDCGATSDLTTDHGIMGDVVCRACNSRRRSVAGGR